MAESTMNFYQHFGSTPVTHDSQYLFNQASNLPQRTSSWPRRPARVSKHASREGSPRSLVRRRTTALVRAPSRQRSIADGRGHQKHFSTPNGLMSLEGRGRPMSWHSTGLEQADHHFSPYSSQLGGNVSSSKFFGPTFTTCEVNGAITPITQPLAGEPFVQDAFTPLGDTSAQDFYNRYAFLNEFSADNDPSYSPQCVPQQPELAEPLQQYRNELYGFQRQAEWPAHYLESTAPPTPEIVPLEACTGFVDDGSLAAAGTAGEDELVGMGLYDAPSPIPATMSLMGDPWDIPIRPALGKGLKLEETFQPTTTEDEGSDAGQEDDDAEEEDGEEGQQQHQQQQQEGPALSQPQDLTMPYQQLEERRPEYEQNGFAEFDFTSDVNLQKNTWWSTDITVNQGWM